MRSLSTIIGVLGCLAFGAVSIEMGCSNLAGDCLEQRKGPVRNYFPKLMLS